MRTAKLCTRILCHKRFHTILTNPNRIIAVRKHKAEHHLDTNHHVNNQQFIDMAMEHLPEGFRIRQVRAEYKKQAFLDDVLVPRVIDEGTRIFVVLEDEQGAPYVIVEYLGQQPVGAGE